MILDYENALNCSLAVSAGLRAALGGGFAGSDDSAGGEHNPGQLRVNDVAVRPSGRAALADDITRVHEIGRAHV